MNARDMHAAAGNLVLSFYVRSQIPEHLGAWQVADERFRGLCEAGAEAGLAQSPSELELLLVDVLDQLPPPDPGDRGGAWIWLMEARFLLSRRLVRLLSAVAA